MPTLESLTPGARFRVSAAAPLCTVVSTKWHGNTCVTVFYTREDGAADQQILYRDSEPALVIEAGAAAFAFDGDTALFKLASEARRIQLAYLFDPFLAVHTSTIMPLPHQITAVYGEMLPRQPLRFLLADDPGAGKTIMAGLYIKELILRGDVKKCLVVAPGSLVEQWQDELWEKFGLDFRIISRQWLEESRSGNPFAEHHHFLARVDQMARAEDFQALLGEVDWDLVIVDEAHKMSAHYFGNELKDTKRYRLGKLLGQNARHFLLMTATPHSGDEPSFQLFMALLDEDRFEGKFRDGVHSVDTKGMMRRLIKEKLLKFDGKPLFPERRAYTANYDLSPKEAALYHAVTQYVREEMDRAKRIEEEGDRRRGLVLGFALTILQRRLASSPEAILRSLERRLKRLEGRLAEARLDVRSAALAVHDPARDIREEDLEDPEGLDELPEEERRQIEEELLGGSTAAGTITELEAELATLGRLVKQADEVRRSEVDSKWVQLRSILESDPHIRDANGLIRKLIIFTEHKDTLDYIFEKLQTLLGRPEAVKVIHGGVKREERRKIQQMFNNDPEVRILLATDAAGEGVNLQRGHLMINYDLPWNPNRIEQRFGRIHRIGQKEVCHLWNLVAHETREGQVFQRLLSKIEKQRVALGDQVYDVLGQVFSGKELRDLLIEAIRYGERPDIRARLDQVVDERAGEGLAQLVKERGLACHVMGAADVEMIREEMEKAEARKLQPHFVESFFREAFDHLGGRMVEREDGRFEIKRVPPEIRSRDRVIGRGLVVLERYERITFEKDRVEKDGKPRAEFVCPGHPLLDATIDLLLERYRTLLKKGAVLVDRNDPSEEPRVLLYLEHEIQDGRLNPDNTHRTISRQFHFVTMKKDGTFEDAGYAPYLDLAPFPEEDLEMLRPLLSEPWLGSGIEDRGVEYALGATVSRHMEEVRRRTIDRVEKTLYEVKSRLLAEINYWDLRAQQLKEQELAGKQPRMNSGRARERAERLQGRLSAREAELAREKELRTVAPIVAGAALVVPEGYRRRLRGEAAEAPGTFAKERDRVERIAVDAVLEAERRLGRDPKEQPHNNPGFDIISRDSVKDRYLFIEVKGRVKGAPTVTITKTEILTSYNKAADYILAIVDVDGDGAAGIHYRPGHLPQSRNLDFSVASINYDLKDLKEGATAPA